MLKRNIKKIYKSLTDGDWWLDAAAAFLRFLIKRNPVGMFHKPFNKKHPYLAASISAILILAIISGSAWFLFLRTPKTQAAWWNDSWAYRKAINIANTSGSELSNQRVKFSLDTASLISVGKMQSDCDDIRVTDASGKVLDHWDTQCNTSSTNVYVKIGNIPTSGADIFLYYGNQSVASIEKQLGTDADPGTSCQMMKDQRGVMNSGIYYVTPGGSDSDKIQVYCDMTTDNKGWSLVLNHVNTATPGANPTWNEIINNVNTSGTYGSDQAAFSLFLGVKHWNYLGNYLRVEVGTNPSTITKRYDYTSFSLNESNYYALTMAGETPVIGSGSPGIYTSHNNMPLTTKDADHDSYANNCANLYNYAWWYTSCWSGSFWGSTVSYQDRAYWTGSSGDYHDYGALWLRGDDSMKNVNGTASSGEEQAPAPAAYWKFDEGNGIITNDSTNNDNDGTTTNIAWADASNCVSENCLYFDGVNDDVALSRDVSINPKKGTVSWWMRKGVVRREDIFARLRNSSSGQIEAMTDNTIRVESFTNNIWTEYYSTGINIFDNKWHNYQLVFDQSESRLYVDGALRDTQTANSDAANFVIRYIGSQQSQTAYGVWYSGYLDEIKIYPFVRNSEQIKMDYNSGIAGSGAAEGLAQSFGGKSDKWLADGLVGHWKMDEASWNGTAGEAKDASGNNNNGTASGGATTGAAKYGNGGSFDGTDDYIDIGNADSIKNITNQITVSAWAKYYAYGGGGQPYSVVAVKGNPWTFLMENPSNKIRFRVTVGGQDLNASDSVSHELNRWYHFVGTYDGQNIKIYKDGQLVGTTPASGALATTDITAKIGTFQGTNYNFNGNIDDVRIYKRALSSEEIRKLYEYAPGPIAYWNLDENNGNSFADKSGNSLNGSLGINSGTPTWVTGKFGSALDFGSGKYAKVSLGSSSGNFATNVSGRSFSYSMWFKSNNVSAVQNLLTNNEACNNPGNFSIRLEGGNVRFVYYGSVGGGANHYFVPSTALQNNQWYHLEWTKTFGQLGAKAYLNGIAQTVSNDSANLGSVNLSNIVLGSYNGDGTTCTTGVDNTPPIVSNSLLGTLDEVRIYNYIRTQEQVIEDMNGSTGDADSGGATIEPMMHWKFDDGNGTVAQDATANNNDGTLTNSPLWNNDGKFGKALRFNGSNNHVTRAAPAGMSPSGGTLSFWSKRINTSTTGSYIFAHPQTGDNSRVYLSYGPNSNTLNCALGNGTIIGSASLNLNQWYYVAVTWNGTSAKFYVDGKLIGSNTFNGLTSIGPIYAGGYPGGNQNFDGLIDDLKIYSGSLSEEEIEADYNQGQSAVLSMAGINAGSGGSANAEYCIPGDSTSCSAPVGEWKFDENQGSAVNDSSGNGYNASLQGGPTWTSGKHAAALQFDGVNDYASITDNANLRQNGSFTMEGWYKKISFANTYPGFFYKGNSVTANGYILFYTSGGQTYYKRNNVQWPVFTNSEIGTWKHFAVVYDSAAQTLRGYLNGQLQNTNAGVVFPANTGTDNLRIGMADEYGNQAMDQVKFFDYARTPAQIAYDYNRGEPIGHWKFDECQGGTAYDSSGNGNNGTITIGATGSQTSLGTCTTASTAWGNGASGKFNGSLSFDGTDDETTVNKDLINGLTGVTASAWIYNTSDYNANIFRTDSAGILLHFRGAGFYLTGNDGTTSGYLGWSNTLPANQWVHVASTWSSPLFGGDGKMRLYVNGNKQATERDFTGGVNGRLRSGSYFRIGGYFNSSQPYFTGKIDDSRLYNYALTDEQIKTVMNEGSALRFGN